MAMDYKEVHLATLNSGAIGDLFEEEFSRMLANIADDNTEPDKVRSITIKVSVKPSKDRSKADSKVQVSSNLAPLKPHESFMIFENTGSEIKAYTTDPKQQDLEDINGTNIISMGKKVGNQ